MPELKTNILDSLSSDEKEVFSILMDTVNKYSPSTTVRVAGGWVRDKLLGLSPNDIDTVVDNVSGVDFAKMVARNMNFKDPSIIKENPEKTKNIESAKIKVTLSSGATQELDFVQARAEEYPNPNSRNPIIRPGTAEEDAMRRDLTINSLFFNINKGILEDFTERGKSDLEKNIIRVPTDVNNPYSDLSPVRTFREDPLRVLRAIRFASRYNAPIAEKTLAAMKDPEIRSAFKTLARERVGEEMSKIVSGPNPAYGIKILKDIGIWQDIMDDSLKGTKFEKMMDKVDMNQNNAHHKFNLWDHTLKVVENVLSRYDEAKPEKRATMVLAALMHDLGKLFKGIQGESKSQHGSLSFHGHDQVSAELTNKIFRFMKMEKYIEQVSKMTKYHLRLEELSRQPNISTKALRKFIRNMTAEGIEWIDMFNLALADSISKSDVVDQNVLNRFGELETQLNDAYRSMKELPAGEKGIVPALNGNELMDMFGVNGTRKKQGPWISEVTEYVLKLMDEEPSIAKPKNKSKLKQMVETEFSQHKENPQQQPIAQPSTSPSADLVTSKSKGNNSGSKYKYCPMHLFIQTKSDLLAARENPSQATFLMNDFVKTYGEDEKVSRLIARELFYASAKEPITKQSELMQYVFSNAEKNFFDPVLCTYALGMMLIFSTATDKEEIEKIGNRMVKMAPKNLKEVLNNLPKNIFHRCLKKRIEKKL